MLKKLGGIDQLVKGANGSENKSSPESDLIIQKMKEIIEFWMSKDKDAFDGFSEESFDWFLSDLYVNLNGGLQNVKEGDTVIKCMSRVRNRTEFTPVNVVHTEPDFIYVTFLADVLRKSKYNRETGICESGPGTGWIITDNRQGGLDAGNLLLVVNE